MGNLRLAGMQRRQVMGTIPSIRIAIVGSARQYGKMAAKKRHVFWILIAVSLLTATFMSWVVLGTPWRAVGRLVNEGVVTSRDSVELLYASGWLRENTYVYRCPKTRLSMPVITGPLFSRINLDDLANAGVRENDVQPLLTRYAANAIDWKTAKLYNGEGPVLLTLITVVVPEKGPDAFGYMFVF